MHRLRCVPRAHARGCKKSTLTAATARCQSPHLAELPPATVTRAAPDCSPRSAALWGQDRSTAHAYQGSAQGLFRNHRAISAGRRAPVGGARAAPTPPMGATSAHCRTRLIGGRTPGMATLQAHGPWRNDKLSSQTIQLVHDGCIGITPIRPAPVRGGGGAGKTGREWCISLLLVGSGSPRVTWGLEIGDFGRRGSGVVTWWKIA